MNRRIDIYTTEELKELLKIRMELDDLHARYDAIVRQAETRKSRPGEPAPGTKGAPDTPAAAPAQPPAGRGAPAGAKPTAPANPAASPDTAEAAAKGTAASGAAPGDGGSGAKPAVEKKDDGTTVVKAPVGTLKEEICSILRAGSGPLTFEDIYEGLESRGAPLPDEKPKLVVRKLLYDRGTFEVSNGRYTLKGG
ncbi:MAG: hypothetical protein JW951_08280 [Lentisphaerae bacterium]|nr:hypothetical protein [Lentisphaerota bacterium]